ncbi:MAG: SHOCT domain-containing protein [Bacteroidetes bacterium]|nr:SHOCT domain-containing protein [Bacteroidota bacterium]
MVHSHWLWGMHWLWWAFWLLAILVISRLFIGRDAHIPPASEETALEILRRRYARGEIGADEYEERKARLEDDQ